MTSETPSGGNEVGRFVGLILIVIGLLWMTATGLCSAAFAISLFAGGGAWREAFSILLTVLLVGGASALVGFGIFAIGRALRPKRD